MFPLVETAVQIFFILSGFLCILSSRVTVLRCWSTHGKQLSLLSVAEQDHNFTVSKQLFIHFYAMALFMNATIFLWELCFRHVLNLYRVLFGIHAFRRYTEQLLMFNRLPASRMHFTAYLFGLSYYVVIPLALCNPCYKPSKIQIITFLLSQLLQFKSHYTLYVAKRDSTKGGVVSYTVPKGGPFNYILCPHYLCEILVYTSLFCNSEMFSALIFVCISMITQAITSKRWYLDTFSPSDLITKDALIPYIL